MTESSGSERSDREGQPGGEAAIDEDIEDSEEEEEEPRLKYQRLSADVADILSGNAASCLCVSDKLLALGVHDGTVHVLDVAGNEVHRRAPRRHLSRMHVPLHCRVSELMRRHRELCFSLAKMLVKNMSTILPA